MSKYKKALKVLASLRGHVDGLGPAIDTLERLSAGHADDIAIQGIMDQLPLHARLAAMHRGRPDVVAHLADVAKRIEAEFADLRELQARRSFEAFGEALGVPSLKAYLLGTDSFEGVIEIPVFPEIYMSHFNETVLVDGRVVEKLGMIETCKLSGLRPNGESDLVPFEPKKVKSGLRWMRFQDGRRNHGKSQNTCRAAFEKFEVGADATEGIARYVQDNTVIHGHFMECPGSVVARNPVYAVFLGIWSGGTGLGWHEVDYNELLCGAASRGE